MTLHVKVVLDENYQRFEQAPNRRWWAGTPVDEVRDTPLELGGRTRLRLFSPQGGQSRPRLQVEALPVTDTQLPGLLDALPSQIPASATELRDLVADALGSLAPLLDAQDLAPGSEEQPRSGQRHRQNTVAALRKRRLFGRARELLDDCGQSGGWSAAELTAGARALTELEWQAYCGEMLLEDQDMGTYYAYTEDKAFVHYLELLLEALPRPGGEAWAVLPRDQRQAVERQRAQVTNHLDYLMRRRYAHDGVIEADIERSLGALMVQRSTHRVVSHDDWAMGEEQVPGFELLQVDPHSGGPHAGAWIHRASDDLRLFDGTVITVDPRHVQATPLEAGQITFLRAPGDARLRPEMHFDWDSNGYITDEPLPWIKWAGFCDVQALMELLGLTLMNSGGVTEYRSDTGQTITYSPELLREMMASVLELGSDYQRVDTGERVRLKERVKGGIRADDRHDRLDFLEPDGRQIVYWPLEGLREDFEVIGMEEPDGQTLDPVAGFHQYMPGEQRLEMLPNPRFQRRAGGNNHYIDAVGLLLKVNVRVDVFDDETGYFRREKQQTLVDLRDEPLQTRCFLGTRLWSSARREVFRYYLDRTDETMVAELDRYELRDGRWQARTLPEHAKRRQLIKPLTCSLMREVLRDNPTFFYPLLEAALRRGEGIIVDSAMGGEVWNGVVTRIDARMTESDPQTRVERWQVFLEARHGKNTMDFLLRRAEDGTVKDACPAPGPDGWGDYPDFLWQYQPDVAPVVQHQGNTLVNLSMYGHGIITVDPSSSEVKVLDDHVGNVHEILHCALAPCPWIIVHQNRRYGFIDRKSWKRVVEKLAALRLRLSFQEDPGRAAPIKKKTRARTD